MKTEYIVLTGLTETSLSVPEQVSNQKEELQISAFAVKTVTNPQQAEQAAYVLKEVSEFLKLIEASRKIVKDPVLAIGKKIDAFAGDLTDKLTAEKTRINRLLGSYQDEENRKAAIAARKAQEEEQRIRDEANAKIAEAQAAGKSEAQIEKIAAKLDAKVTQAVAVTAAAVAPKQEGIATRKTTKFEVLDMDALYAARPELVVLEPNNAAIRALLAASPNAKIPGIRTWTEAVAIVR
jgi:hypothetical protein